MFVIGLVGFGVASAAGGAATSYPMLVGARAAQGAFGAVLAPAALALLTTTFTDAKSRARAFGVYAALAGGGAAVGLLLGGVLVQYLNWRWCMFVNVGFVATALVGAGLFLPHESRVDPSYPRRARDRARLSQLVRARVRLLSRFDRRLVEHHHARLRRRRCRSARWLHLSPDAGLEPGPATARGARPQPRRGLFVDLHPRTRPVRDVAVRHLLLPADARLHRDPVRARLSSVARRVHDHVPSREPE